MTATATKPGRTRDPKAGTCTVVASQPELFTKFLVLVHGGTSGQLNVLTEDGQPLADNLGIGRRAGNILHELASPRVLAAIAAHGARVIVVHPSAVEAAVTRLTPPSQIDACKRAYEKLAVTTPGGLLALPGYDEFEASWRAEQTPAGDPLEALRADLEAKLAKAADVAVLLVHTNVRTNDYFKIGVAANALSYDAATQKMEDGADARRAADQARPGRNAWSPPSPSTYSQPGHIPAAPTVMGNIGDVAQEWGVPEPVETDPAAPAGPSLAASLPAAPGPDLVTHPWLSGAPVTEVEPATLAAIMYMADAGIGAGTGLIHVNAELSSLAITWGHHQRNHVRWPGDPRSPAATDFVVTKVREIADVRANRPLAVIVDAEGLDLERIATYLPVVHVQHPEA